MSSHEEINNTQAEHAQAEPTQVELPQVEQPQVAEASTMTTQQAVDNNPNPLPLGYSVEGLAKPGQFADKPAFPGLNLNENLEKQFKNNFRYMINLFEEGNSAAAEREAVNLLQWGSLPCLYRVYSHIVLAYGPGDRLYHACKAVREAEWGVKRYGDDNGVGTELLDIANKTLNEVNADAADAMNRNPEDEMVVEDQEKSQEDKIQENKNQENESVGVRGEQATNTSHDEDTEMLLDQPFSGIMAPPAAPGLRATILLAAAAAVTAPTPIAAPVATSDDGAKASFSSQVTRTSSGGTNITRMSSSTTNPSRTTSNTTDQTDFTDFADFASQVAHAASQEADTEADQREKREKRERSDGSQDDERPKKKLQGDGGDDE